ncbi:ethanolamine ammonia-lyase subunit EutC [Methylocapsa palsarum]|uniref:Ethanolamine ammonia-lyase small subunit n=1 Tax=Methylocapsa palsarum TaxID=1612308 RepID=A0A1I3Z716_9HYPH|nr:ethanolamine ammonia-lyase subunit EutC [Methylocapsa palsarum]SFK39491.1 ethanolamine ammonia-lyase small subunit [Methylocapsa palsarum]
MTSAQEDFWAFLRAATPARIALGRTGDSLPTRRVLDFQLAHEQARDAVHAELDADALGEELSAWTPAIVHSEAADRTSFLQRPDLGRALSPHSAKALIPGNYDVTIVIADGLSAAAAQTLAPTVCRMLLAQDFVFAPPVVAVQARVALGDEIAVAQGARMVVMLIGERPGLSACRSLGAYVTFDPRPGVTTDAGRNCVSNIRPGGLSAEEASSRILAIMRLAQTIKATGTRLKEDAALALTAPQNIS